MEFKKEDQKSEQKSVSLGSDLKAIKKVEIKKIKKVNMVSIAYDGYGNRVFMSEEKIECFGIKLGDNFIKSYDEYNALTKKEKAQKLKDFRNN